MSIFLNWATSQNQLLLNMYQPISFHVTDQEKVLPVHSPSPWTKKTPPPSRLNFIRTFCENPQDTLSVPITFRNPKNCQIFVTNRRASTSCVYARLLQIHLTQKLVCDTHISIPRGGMRIRSLKIDPPLPEYSKRKQECLILCSSQSWG